MGYSTDFKGILYFTRELSEDEKYGVENFFSEDCRNHPEWGRTDLTHIDLCFCNEEDGIEWDGSEKTYDLVDKINLIIKEMRKKVPDFELEGKMIAQGEDIDDRWMIVIEDGFAKETQLVVLTEKAKCPHCGEEFYPGDVEFSENEKEK